MSLISFHRERPPNISGRRVYYRRPLEERFWDFVNKTETCWLWTGSHFSNGYGKFQLSRDITIGAHQVAYELAYGPISKGLEVLHKCDVKDCVRPEHLFKGTQLNNVQDMITKGRANFFGGLIPTAKINMQIAEEIRVLCRCGEKQKDVAVKFGIDKSIVSKIVGYKIWIPKEVIIAASES